MKLKQLGDLFENVKSLYGIIGLSGIAGVWKLWREFRKSKSTDAKEEFENVTEISDNYIANYTKLIAELAEARMEVINLKIDVEVLILERNKDKAEIEQLRSELASIKSA